jgi:hypothetical protein
MILTWTRDMVVIITSNFFCLKYMISTTSQCCIDLGPSINPRMASAIAMTRSCWYKPIRLISGLRWKQQCDILYISIHAYISRLLTLSYLGHRYSILNMCYAYITAIYVDVHLSHRFKCRCVTRVTIVRMRQNKQGSCVVVGV